LRKGVFKGEVGLAAVERAKEDAERNQEQRPPDCVHEHLGKQGALPLAASDRIRKRYADQERKGWLDHIVQRTTEPLRVGLVEGKNFPEKTVVVVCGNFGELEHFAHHQQHDQAAIRIYRQIAHRGRSRADSCGLTGAYGYCGRRPGLENLAHRKLRILCLIAYAWHLDADAGRQLHGFCGGAGAGQKEFCEARRTALSI
jgi:hypothetical protein